MTAAGIIAADAGAPSLARSLRSGPTAEALARVLGAPPVETRLERTHFPAGRPVQMVLSCRLADGRQAAVIAEYVPGAAEAHAAEANRRLAKSRHGQRAGIEASPVVADAATGLVLRRAGLDERLPGLRLLHERGAARDAIRRLLDDDPGPVAVSLAAHRLGRRAVLRLDAGGLRLYARLHAVKAESGIQRAARHAALWDALRTAGRAGFDIPAPVGTLPELGAAVVSALPGRMADPADPSAAMRVGQALGSLQALRLHGLPVHDGAAEAEILTGWLSRLGGSFPGRASPRRPRRFARSASPSCPVTGTCTRSRPSLPGAGWACSTSTRSASRRRRSMRGTTTRT